MQNGGYNGNMIVCNFSGELAHCNASYQINASYGTVEINSIDKYTQKSMSIVSNHSLDINFISRDYFSFEWGLKDYNNRWKINPTVDKRSWATEA